MGKMQEITSLPTTPSRSFYASSIADLVEVLTPYQIEKLAELTQDVISKTGYGSISIVVSEKRVSLLQATYSHKARSSER